MDAVRIQMPQEMLDPAAFLHLEEDWNLEFLKSGANLFEFIGPVKWKADFTNTGGAILVTGTVEGTAKTQCSRCLEEAVVPLVGDIEGYFVFSADDDSLEEMEEDEFEVLADDRVIDMAPLITSALILDAPQIPLCDDDCKGLCPQCGTNLNTGECDCAPEKWNSSQNPFAKLKDMKFE